MKDSQWKDGGKKEKGIETPTRVSARAIMSAPKVPPIKPKKDRDREKKDKERLSQPPTTERLKTVVRRLPPNLPEDIFWQSVQSWVSDETVTWKAFYPGKMRKRYIIP